MWSGLIQFATSSVAGLIATLVVVASLVGSGAYVDHEIMGGKMASLKAGYAQAQAQAVAEAAARQKQLDQTTLAAVNAEVAKQKELGDGLQGRLAYLVAHPNNRSVPCVPWGFVRLLNSAILGVAPASVHLPTGAADGACSTISADTVGRTLVSNFGAANANAEQLTALQSWARQIAGVKQ